MGTKMLNILRLHTGLTEPFHHLTLNLHGQIRPVQVIRRHYFQVQQAIHTRPSVVVFPEFAVVWSQHEALFQVVAHLRCKFPTRVFEGSGTVWKCRIQIIMVQAFVRPLRLLPIELEYLEISKSHFTYKRTRPILASAMSPRMAERALRRSRGCSL